MKTISFFSYKGGAGRSTLAFNTIPLLAHNHIHPTAKNPMIVVDMDLDSCGMSYLLKAEDKITMDNCVQKMLGDRFDCGIEYDSIAEQPFLKNLIPVGNAFGYEDNKAILLLPAKDGALINPNSKSNYGDSESFYQAQMDRFCELCMDYDVSAIIFDSSVGHNATANISNAAANTIVCCMRPTTQFTNGTYRFLLDAENKLTRGKHIILVPNVLPQEQTVIDDRTYPYAAEQRIIGQFSDFNQHALFNYHMDMLDPGEFGIPMVPRFMWREDILCVQSELTSQEQTALERYEKLARIINDIEEL